LDTLDKEILNYIQNEFPLCDNPYSVIADKFSISVEELIKKLKVLKKEGIIRDICGIFDGKKLGYHSCLVAMEVDKDSLSALVEDVNSLYGVSHNYGRNHRFNIWFTLAAPCSNPLDDIVRLIAKKHRVNNYLLLPSVKTFKLKVSFDLIEEKPKSVVTSAPNITNAGSYQFSDIDRSIIKELQKELPLEQYPFREMAKRCGLDTKLFVAKANAYLNYSIMRRYSATLRHIKAGFKKNAMLVWKVDKEDIDKIGAAFAEKSFISHCYERITSPEWLYNLYTMVHAKDDAELDSYIQELRQVAPDTQMLILESTKEYKKERVKYFLNDSGLCPWQP